MIKTKKNVLITIIKDVLIFIDIDTKLYLKKLKNIKCIAYIHVIALEFGLY